MIEANADPPPGEEFLTRQDIAAECRVSAPQVSRWMSPGGIRVGAVRVSLHPTVVVGSRVLVSRADLDAFKAACRAAKFGDDRPRAETPTAEARRGAAAKDRLAKRLAGAK